MLVGDSLGLPRENLLYENTWPYMLTQDMPGREFVYKLQRALTTAMLFGGSQGDFLEYYKPDVVVMQVGIVDCAPRHLKNNGIAVKLLGVMPGFIKSRIWQLIKRYKKRTASNTDVSLQDFENFLLRYCKRAKNIHVKKIIFIKIASPGRAMLEKNPGIQLQVDRYNNIYDAVAKQYDFVSCIDTLSISPAEDYFLEDGYHLSGKGGQVLTAAIIKEIQNSQV